MRTKLFLANLWAVVCFSTIAHADDLVLPRFIEVVPPVHTRLVVDVARPPITPPALGAADLPPGARAHYATFTRAKSRLRRLEEALAATSQHEAGPTVLEARANVADAARALRGALVSRDASLSCSGFVLLAELREQTGDAAGAAQAHDRAAESAASGACSGYSLLERAGRFASSGNFREAFATLSDIATRFANDGALLAEANVSAADILRTHPELAVELCASSRRLCSVPGAPIDSIRALYSVPRGASGALTRYATYQAASVASEVSTPLALASLLEVVAMGDRSDDVARALGSLLKRLGDGAGQRLPAGLEPEFVARVRAAIAEEARTSDPVAWLSWLGGMCYENALREPREEGATTSTALDITLRRTREGPSRVIARARERDRALDLSLERCLETPMPGIPDMPVPTNASATMRFRVR